MSAVRVGVATYCIVKNADLIGDVFTLECVVVESQIALVSSVAQGKNEAAKEARPKKRQRRHQYCFAVMHLPLGGHLERTNSTAVFACLLEGGQQTH